MSTTKPSAPLPSFCNDLGWQIAEFLLGQPENVHHSTLRLRIPILVSLDLLQLVVVEDKLVRWDCTVWLRRQLHGGWGTDS